MQGSRSDIACRCQQVSRHLTLYGQVPGISLRDLHIVRIGSELPANGEGRIYTNAIGKWISARNSFPRSIQSSRRIADLDAAAPRITGRQRLTPVSGDVD